MKRSAACLFLSLGLLCGGFYFLAAAQTVARKVKVTLVRWPYT
jgi:hypothetical protein